MSLCAPPTPAPSSCTDDDHQYHHHHPHHGPHRRRHHRHLHQRLQVVIIIIIVVVSIIIIIIIVIFISAFCVIRKAPLRLFGHFPQESDALRRVFDSSCVFFSAVNGIDHLLVHDVWRRKMTPGSNYFGIIISSLIITRAIIIWA